MAPYPSTLEYSTASFFKKMFLAILTGRYSTLHGSFASAYKLWSQVVVIHKITQLDLDCLTYIEQIGKNVNFDNVEPFYKWTWDILPFIVMILFLGVL